MRSLFLLAPAAIPLVAITFADLSAQSRSGLWANASVGYGAISCRGCNSGDGGTSLSVSGGYTPNPRFMVGGAIMAWRQSNDATDTETNAQVISAVARFYPFEFRLFLHGGLGVTRSTFGAVSGTRASDLGWTTMGGFGYDIRLTNRLNLTPCWTGVTLLTARRGELLNQGIFGVGVTVH
jgi:hypothetical protein